MIMKETFCNHGNRKAYVKMHMINCFDQISVTDQVYMDRSVWQTYWYKGENSSKTDVGPDFVKGFETETLIFCFRSVIANEDLRHSVKDYVIVLLEAEFDNHPNI